ncbi:WD repeat-containing protein 91 [Pleodorina starrii]|uniref:WD repeat-containing protein 91 n=1 Tax=Pleodorina starrii TaxID=330485 RepID=A0A9W6F4S2_9CHLO|nr:WD repeat-containing protein 91 [Pleodorina starrii]GLC56219.1 WD repeat-containing protein 91 [Pleodorina starrii]
MSRTSGEPRQTPSGGGAPTPYGTGPSSFCEKEQYGAGGEGAEGEEGLLDEGLVEGEGSDEETWGSSGYDPGTAPSTASPGVNQTPRSNRISRQRRQAAAAAAGGGGGGGAASEGGGLGSGGAFSPLRKRTAAVASGGGGGGVLKQHCGVDEPYAPPDTRFGGDTSRGGGGGGAAKLPANYFLDEQEEIARHPFPIPPADLVEMARQVLAVGVYKWPHLSEDFQFSAPFIGPLGPEQFRSTLSSLELEEAFPDLEPRYHHLRVDPFRCVAGEAGAT